MANEKQDEFLSQEKRLVAFALYAILLLALSKAITGEWFDPNEGKRLWLLSALGYYVLTLISSPFFRPPRDSLANSLSTILLLCYLNFDSVQYFAVELNRFRWIATGTSALTLLAAIASMALHKADPVAHPKKAKLAAIGYALSDALGRGEIIFTPPVMISVIGFHQSAPMQQLALLFCWTVLIAVKPIELAMKLAAKLRRLGDSSGIAAHVGSISRIDNPGIIRVTLHPSAKWDRANILTACLPTGEQVGVIPLFTHIQESELVGTGFRCRLAGGRIPEVLPGQVYRPETPIDSRPIFDELCGGDAEMAGFVIEDSTIATIKFESSPDTPLEEGLLAFCRQDGKTIYYQIIDARTSEETFERNPRGRHIVTATQLGCIDAEKGFVKFGWLPSMNAPVFLPRSPVGGGSAPGPKEFFVGKVPGSEISVRAYLPELIEYHAAILGVTGTGKTELALDVIREAVKQGAKIFCVDFTGEYKVRLQDLAPVSLSLSSVATKELETNLAKVEMNKGYKGDEFREVLKEFLIKIKKDVRLSVEKFLVDTTGSSVGIFELPEITNSSATLRATELYLSSIMEWARGNRKARQILIVLEEAHTIIPETGGAGLDFDTQWVVGRIAQIALQGRKYGVGLLVLSQRTALVSKSILSQCNTYFAFSLIDKTSLDYLSNVFSPEHVKGIPNLRFLEAMAFGKAVRSERPILVKLPYDAKKKAASDELNVKVVAEPAKPAENAPPAAAPAAISPIDV